MKLKEFNYVISTLRYLHQDLPPPGLSTTSISLSPFLDGVEGKGAKSDTSDIAENNNTRL